MDKYMNKYEQLYIYDKVCVYNGVYEGNIPVSMIHLHTRGSGLIFEERPIEFIQQLCKQVFTKGLGTYTYMEAHVLFLGRFKENLHFLICYSKLKNKLIEVCTKKCIYKKVYNEIPNFMYRNGTYTYVEAHVLFYKTWLIILKKRCEICRLKNSLKVCFERVFCTK